MEKSASENYIYAKWWCRKAKRYAWRKLWSFFFRRYSFKFINISLSIGKTVVFVISSVSSSGTSGRLQEAKNRRRNATKKSEWFALDFAWFCHKLIFIWIVCLEVSLQRPICFKWPYSIIKLIPSSKTTYGIPREFSYFKSFPRSSLSADFISF